ncbi:hypothetical protein SRB5_50140 [Streptomyces sp. RB5]|uniref:Uncharacterized protein n=1 Tax=Streptomyces smaragdinus TaxID=2585196 RepID=A0A7K0CMX3_9ACTN|nr:hypothetical protein [Streptomyces smaragdinus]MQY14838.1 hypothetical protein [Streptomyces smaragdinus]
MAISEGVTALKSYVASLTPAAVPREEDGRRAFEEVARAAEAAARAAVFVRDDDGLGRRRRWCSLGTCAARETAGCPV